MNDANTIKCAIVDDEKLARDLLQDLIKLDDNLELKGKFKNTYELKAFLKHSSIDLLFLDIQMPAETGMEFLKKTRISPKVVFTTAYTEYAAESYELEVIDYLLKPITEERFLKCMEKVHNVLETEKKAKAYEISINKHESDFFYLRSGARQYKIAYAEVILFEADGEYIVYHTIHEKYMILGSLKKLALELPQDKFLQVHRSFIVPFSNIKGREKYTLLLGDGQKIPIGKTFRTEVLKKLS
ncbi:Transcriptional regulatory protein YpdB [Salinivirga cyanobacteriivorans]|uniref:Transcriptional regulatory protein YpdB n=1 Tax=Salinivirga cyanobacteriivorans TaxID=1307839 RepID=A0A0S2I195_9BACT|nr:LytTR family DNA-binding domain-containing protein [Salinivirga cyanobacteriivorans]ALO16090.1 Transcriptional regulatory protein YpdB [Salinivirga cyanobacteriivorans]